MTPFAVRSPISSGSLRRINYIRGLHSTARILIVIDC
jgi:hypothetical protein